MIRQPRDEARRMAPDIRLGLIDDSEATDARCARVPKARDSALSSRGDLGFNLSRKGAV